MCPFAEPRSDSPGIPNMTHDWLVALTAFAASSVEMVEAATIVLAVGLTYDWRTAFKGIGAALVLLAAVTAVLGPAILSNIPLNLLQLIVGSLLLVFGLQWMGKAILRASNLKAKHDEDAIFQEEIQELETTRQSAMDSAGAGFLISFKGVFLEGLEVVFIVITFGAASGRTDLTSIGAAAAVVVVIAALLVLHRPLARVPENGIKMGVGLMLVTFGTFWAGEGAGYDWWGGDAMIFLLLGVYAATAAALVWALRSGMRIRKQQPLGADMSEAMLPVRGAYWVYEFLAGDSRSIAVGAGCCVVGAWALSVGGLVGPGEVVLPAAVVGVLSASFFLP